MNLWDSFWNFFWFLFWIYAFMAFLGLLFSLIADLFRDRALNGWIKAIWLICLVFIPFISALVYLITRGDDMAARKRQASAGQGARGVFA